MGFKEFKRKTATPSTPEELFLELSGRKYPNVLSHQSDVLRAYSASATDSKDVALELPTGSGKTLVGLLIAEWRRRKFEEKVVFLCPTRQLVNQVVEEANKVYGMNVEAFTGKKSDYTPQQKSSYQLNKKVAVTTYNSLFNSNPFFSSPDTVILDDAHAAENYIGSNWTVSIERQNPDHADLHSAIAHIILPFLKPVDRDRLMGKFAKPADVSWVDKISTRDFANIEDQLQSAIDSHVSSHSSFRYAWSAIRDNFHACHLFVSAKELIIRPAVFPTWTHAGFSDAKQRIFMSATIGAGGELERITSRVKIQKIAAPKSIQVHGIGRRFFLFPDFSLNADECDELTKKIIKIAGRALYLVPSVARQEKAKEILADIKAIKLFDASDLEKSKSAFTESELAVAVLANRYDGLDFRGDACRVMFIEGLPRATNLYERFLMDKMGASVVFNERLQTRVIQAVGRCTRSLEDYSAVIVMGEDIPEYLVNPKNRKYLHPNLQAEIEFGEQQSGDENLETYEEYMRLFLQQGEDWQSVNDQIIHARNELNQDQFPSIALMESSVEEELKYQKSMWAGDFEQAKIHAEAVIGIITGPGELRGYRAWWHYLAGSACELATKYSPLFATASDDHYEAAKKAAPTLQWLVALCAKNALSTSVPSDYSPYDLAQIQGLEIYLDQIGAKHQKVFETVTQNIWQNLNKDAAKPFELGIQKLGELIGFEAFNDDTDGAPDGWWIAGDACLVFEAHSDSDGTSSIGSRKARQISSHSTWLKENGKIDKDIKTISVLISPCKTIKAPAHGLLSDSSYWNIEDFRNWASNAILQVRKIRNSFSKPGDLVWQGQAITQLSKHKLAFSDILSHLDDSKAVDMLEPVE